MSCKVQTKAAVGVKNVPNHKVQTKAVLHEGVTPERTQRQKVQELEQKVTAMSSIIDRWALIMEPVEKEANRIKALDPCVSCGEKKDECNIDWCSTNEVAVNSH